ncbi:uncharacterized [Tachysurus ichikawai]
MNTSAGPHHKVVYVRWRDTKQAFSTGQSTQEPTGQSVQGTCKKSRSHGLFLQELSHRLLLVFARPPHGLSPCLTKWPPVPDRCKKKPVHCKSSHRNQGSEVYLSFWSGLSEFMRSVHQQAQTKTQEQDGMHQSARKTFG